jgi:hypothetical protein
MTERDPELQAAIRAEVRSYLVTASRRYVPIVVAVLTLVLLVVLVPDHHAPSNVPSGAGTVDAGGQAGQADTGSTPGEASGPASAATGSAHGSSGGFRTTGGTGAATAAATGAASDGIAVSGVKCGAGVRQVTWSPYSPMCVPRWSGNNGGATSHGVTGSTITLVLRKPTDWDSLSAGTGAPTFAQMQHDTQVLVNFFNGQFELYGRKVVVKTFNGQGSFTTETADQGQAAASADAQTASDLGAFVDGWPFATGTYADAEAARKIIHFAPGNSLSSYKPNQPYRYGLPAGPVSETQGYGVAAVGCQRMANMKAAFAGDTAYQALNRKFAVLEPEQPAFAGGADVVVQQMKAKCNVQVEKITYSTDLSTMPQQATQITARLKADNVTTLFMLTDPLMAQFMTSSASAQAYRPEWVFTVWAQAMARQGDQSELAHAIVVAPWHATIEPPSGRLCARIYKLADPGGTPQGGPSGLDLNCPLLMAMYAGLQQAGPNLTPQTFESGWFHLPDSNGTSDFGRWSFAANQFSPLASFSLLWWNGSAKSQYDGGTGEFEPCRGPVDFPYLNPQLGSGPLTCFGQ